MIGNPFDDSECLCSATDDGNQEIHPDCPLHEMPMTDKTPEERAWWELVNEMDAELSPADVARVQGKLYKMRQHPSPAAVARVLKEAKKVVRTDICDCPIHSLSRRVSDENKGA